MIARRIKLTLKTLIGPFLVLVVLVAALMWVPFNHYMVHYAELPDSLLLGVPSLRDASLASLRAVPDYYSRQLFNKANVTKLTIEIKPKHFDKLAAKRDEAIEIGRIVRKLLAGTALVSTNYVPDGWPTFGFAENDLGDSLGFRVQVTIIKPLLLKSSICPPGCMWHLPKT